MRGGGGAPAGAGYLQPSGRGLIEGNRFTGFRRDAVLCYALHCRPSVRDCARITSHNERILNPVLALTGDTWKASAGGAARGTG